MWTQWPTGIDKSYAKGVVNVLIRLQLLNDIRFTIYIWSDHLGWHRIIYDSHSLLDMLQGTLDSSKIHRRFCEVIYIYPICHHIFQELKLQSVYFS